MSSRVLTSTTQTQSGTMRSGRSSESEVGVSELGTRDL